ncbi:MAG TPA: hypothetical protein DDW90_01915 [Cyanobacteria bacterium UBA9971]|nr:hypothetical protein [Cyanobacteria bacterium UBA9971]
MSAITLTNYTKPYKPSFTGRKIPAFKTYGVTQTFEKEITEGLTEYPKTIFNKIKKKFNPNTRLAPKASDAFPDSPYLQNQVKTELCPGTQMTHDQCLTASSIVATRNDGTVVEFLLFCEKPELSKGATKGAVGHELTHKAARLLNVDISQLDGFKDAVRKDLNKLSERKTQSIKIYNQYDDYTSKNVKYLTQNSTPENLDPYGLGEIFAESGAYLTTGNGVEISNKKKSKFMGTFFPESVAYVRKYFYLLGMK